jgi:hypothetical protein
MIIDPPSELAGLSAWARFRREMERLAKADPGNSEIAEQLNLARTIEAQKRG